MNSIRTLTLLAAVVIFTATSSRADHAVSSPRGQNLHAAALSDGTQDRIDRNVRGYSGRTPFERRASTTVDTTCKMNGKDCTMQCCVSGKKVAIYTGRTGGLDVGSTVKDGCKAIGSDCTMGCCTKA